MTAHKYIPLYGIVIIWPLLKNTDPKFCINHTNNIIIFFVHTLLFLFSKPMQNFLLSDIFSFSSLRSSLIFVIFNNLIMFIPFWFCSTLVCMSVVCGSHCDRPGWHTSVCALVGLFPKRTQDDTISSQSPSLSVFNFALAEWL